MKSFYSIYDKKAGTYSDPFVSDDVSALRQFSILCMDADTLINRFNDDFDLVKVGYFDEMKGIVLSPDGDKPLFVASAAGILSKSNTDK